MKVIVSPDSFKECMTSRQVAAALGAAARECWPGADVLEIPLADGGEGSLDVLADAMGASMHQARVHDPLGRPVQARYATLGDIAIIEVAQAIGLSLLKQEERAPLLASSQGVGELMLAAYGQGCRRFIIGLGGSATCDGGAGILNAPGIETLFNEVHVELLSDVDAPFTGSKGAARVFAPQKGATPADVEVLERRMCQMATYLYDATGVNVTDLRGAGAAGGLGGFFAARFQASIYQGIDRILDLLHFDDTIRDAYLIITGEGRSDAQTLMGKVPFGVLHRARSLSPAIRVALLSGRIDDRALLKQAGFLPVVEVSPRNIPVQDALQPDQARFHLRKAVYALAEKTRQ